MTLDAVASRAAKQAGMQLSIMFDGEWAVAVLAELHAWLAARAAAGEREFTFEQFRHDAAAQPMSHKSWGSLPAIACREGLIEPLVHPDGSPVMRRAESVKTHSHPVRVWRLASSFSAAPTGTECPSTHDREPAEAVYQPQAGECVGECRHGGDASELLSATASYHRTRAAMGGQG